MGKANSQTNPKSTNNKFWQFRNLAGDDQKAELLLYGDISERSWWEDAATPKRFADDLAALGDVKEITVYINSGGGDVFAAQAIGNMLERNAATVTAHIDGLCASAATIVACHADKVVAAADSSYMVHPVSMGVCDYLTAEDLNNCLKALETIRSSIVTLYAKKSGKTEDECAKWMDETNWWTATEAKEKGFVDEVDDEADDSVVENRNGILFVNSISMNTPFNKAPNFVRSRVVDKTTAQPENTPQADQPGNKTHGEVTDMDIKDIKTVDDLRKACPDLVAKIETEAINAERTRIQEIENATLPGVDIYGYDEVYLDEETGETKPLIPDNMVLMIPSNANFMRAYGLCTYLDDDKVWHTAETTRLLRSYVEHRPDRRFLELQTHPLLIPDKVDSWLVATVC